jgi:hypothetical protein
MRLLPALPLPCTLVVSHAQSEEMLQYCDPAMSACDYIIGVGAVSTAVYTLQV